MPGADTIPPLIAAIVKKSANKRSKADRKALVTFQATEDEQSKKIAKQITAVKEQLAGLKEDTTLVMVELPQPRMSYVFNRGDYRSQGEIVTPAAPDVLHPMINGPPNRLTLAKWLVAPQNPLVARVTVNRWWAEIFGQGIIPTLEDFGIKGDAPSHPELLDWLAVEFVEGGWSMKHLLRTIVTSSTYRQSSVVTGRLHERDPTNRLLARGSRFRMDAESIRDNALAIAGLLNLKQFGPPIRPFQPDGIWSKVGGESYKYEVSKGNEQHRRGVYVVLKRGAPYPSFVNFDATARLSCTIRRSRTNTPLQALTLLNDPVYVEAAESLAIRVLNETTTTAPTAQKLAFAFQLCTARLPTEEEVDTLSDLLETQHSIAKASRQAVHKKAPFDPPNGITDSEFSAWCAVTTALLNLHETITKN